MSRCLGMPGDAREPLQFFAAGHRLQIPAIVISYQRRPDAA